MKRLAVHIMFCSSVYMFFLILPYSVHADDADNARRTEVSNGAKPCNIEKIERPYVLLNRETLESLKRAIAEPGRKKEIYEKTVKHNADRWVVREIAIPERAGHYHHFVCSDDGVRLIPPADQQIGTKGPYRCPACGKTYTGEKYEAARRHYEHNWLVHAARDLALVGALEKDKRYTEKAAEILRNYADAYPGRHTSPLKGGFVYQSLGEAMFMIPLAQAYDLVCYSGALTEKDKDHILHDLFWESAEGLSHMGTRGNWGSWHLSAVGTVGLATKHQRFIDFALKEFKRQITEELGDDGLWPESVHTYHFFPLGAFLAYAEVSTNTGTDLFTWEAQPGKGLKTMLTAPLSYMYPDLQLPAINDGWFESYIPVEQYELGYYRYGSPEFAWVLHELYTSSIQGRAAGSAEPDYINTVTYGQTLPETTSPPELKSTNFHNIGICTLRSNPGHPEIMLTFDYGRMLGHGQRDKMGITLFANDRILAADYGTPSYGSAILPYYQGTLSHNTIMVDGENQQPTKKAELLAFEDKDFVKVASALTDEAYPGVMWRRTVLLMNDTVLLIDELSSTNDHTYDWFLHSEGDIFEIENATKGTTPETFGFKYITDAVEYEELPEYSKAWWKFSDGTGLLISAYTEPGTQIFSARSPAETAARTVPVLVLRKSGTSCRFVSALRPYTKDEMTETGLSEFAFHINDKDEIIVTSKGKRHTVKMTEHGMSYDGGQGYDMLAIDLMRTSSGQPDSGKGKAADTIKPREGIDAFDTKFIKDIMKQTFEYQVSHPIPVENAGWERGAFYTGIMTAYHATKDEAYLDQALKWAKENKWELNDNRLGYWFGDNQTCAQTYLELYFLKGGDEKIAHVKKILDEMVANPPKGKEQWWWCDSLYMAPPVFVRLARATGDMTYIDVMNKMWWDTKEYLYDTEEHLFYRDKNFFDKRSTNGKKVFWSRGNGWVIAGIVRVLQYLPEDNPRRDDFIAVYREMAEALKNIQSEDGLWRMSLLDPEENPAPETSGSGFYTFALTYGINNGLLDRETYLPVVKKACEGLVACVSEDGRLGYVQQPATAPTRLSPTSTHEYGVGAFLLTGSEMLKLVEK